MHPEGCPWYPILVKLLYYNLITPIILEAQSRSNEIAPVSSMQDAGPCLRFLTPIMFNDVKEKISLSYEIRVPFLNEKSSEQHYNSIRPLCKIAHYAAAKHLLQELTSENDVNTYIHYYYSVVAPDIDLRTFLEYVGKGPGNDLELLSVNDLHIQRDIMAVLDNNHPWYFLVQWILHNGGDNLLSILQQLTPEMLEQMEDEIDTKVLKIIPYAASLGSCIDHVRSYRRGADDYIDADLTLGGEVLLLTPKPRLPKGYIVSINRLNQFNKMPENPLIEETLEWILNIPSLTYQIYGGGFN